MTAEHQKTSAERIEPNMGKESAPKKPGPMPGSPTRKYNVLLDEELAEWGKAQPGGLSELLRRILKEERSRLTR